MIEKPADTGTPIHELLRRRWSPRAFADREVEPEKLRALWEAARWAPSSSNEQPWSFVVARREDRAEFDRLLGCLVEGNVVWARHAPVLMLAVARLSFERSGRTNRHALYDVGQAVACLTVQATALGLHVHQMAGFDAQRARATFDVPDGQEPATAVAIGYLGEPDSLPDALRERELAPRSRRPLGGMVFTGRWGRSSPLLSGEKGAPGAL